MRLPIAIDLDRTTVIRAPEREEPGHWVGCPSVLVEGHRTWLTYRERRPRGVAQDRGWRCAIAASDDGIRFDDVWDVRKEALETPSMERFDLVRTPAGYELYLSFVDPVDGRWRIDAIQASSPDLFDVAMRRPVLTAASTGTEGVKDPVIVAIDGATHLYASFAAARRDIDPAAHASGDIYNVGATTHPTGLATRGPDGFAWRGEVLSVGPTGAWDAYQARLGCVVPVEGGFIGIYDGSASHLENYEERLGLATSSDGITWSRATLDGPWLRGPGPTGSGRYADVVTRDREWWVYLEVTRPDAAHELRLARVGAP